MKRCDKMVEVGRRQFLRGGFATAAALPMVGLMAKDAKAASNGALLDYPSAKLANVKNLKVNTPMEISYPDADAPGVLMKLGKAVEGGAGPDGDIVGFTTVCPHKGFPLSYNAESRTMNCPGHYSVFDCEAGGQQTWGQATQNLPQYILRVDDRGDIYAEGVDELLYGRLSNVLRGGKSWLSRETSTVCRSSLPTPKGTTSPAIIASSDAVTVPTLGR